MQVALLGLGLVGGSVARSVRASTDWRLTAWTPEGRGPAAAVRSGILQVAASTVDEAVLDADLVVIAAPPLDALRLVARLGESRSLPRRATVSDVVSTKAAITEAAREARIPFVGGHPMAGGETAGFERSTADLFRDRPWVVTEPVGGGDATRVEALARACGAVPVRMEAGEHDRAVAAISHLPLVASVALVEAVMGARGRDAADRDVVRRLAASGWRDMTRLAHGDAAMGAGIIATNGAAIADRLRAYRDTIDQWLALIDDEGLDADAIRERLEDARTR